MQGERDSPSRIFKPVRRSGAVRERHGIGRSLIRGRFNAVEPNTRNNVHDHRRPFGVLAILNYVSGIQYLYIVYTSVYACVRVCNIE